MIRGQLRAGHTEGIRGKLGVKRGEKRREKQLPTLDVGPKWKETVQNLERKDLKKSTRDIKFQSVVTTQKGRGKSKEWVKMLSWARLATLIGPGGGEKVAD